MSDSICVVDCSYVAAFLLGESKGNRFVGTLKAFMGEGKHILVPGLFSYEIMNVLLISMRKQRIKAEDVSDITKDLQALKLERECALTNGQMDLVFDLADQHKLTFYDASYLELAIRKKAHLKTLERDLLNLRTLYPWISDR